MSRQWKHQIAASLVTREGSTTSHKHGVACMPLVFQSPQFLEMNKTHMSAQISRDLGSRETQNVF